MVIERQENVRDQELRDLDGGISRVWELGSALGLDPFSTHFELVPATRIYEVGAYGLPGRFAHWSFGKDYHVMKTMYDYGLSKIYELVINTNPAYAALLEGNPRYANLLVAAHVMAHVDFFKHNVYFEHTRRDADAAANRAERIRKHAYEQGEREVEELLDIALALERHIDPQSVRFRKKTDEEYERERLHPVRKDSQGEYDDVFELVPTGPRERAGPASRKIPPEPEHDILSFFIKHGELEEWQREILGIVRDEAYYFHPQRMTRLMNEGWASLWHRRIMRLASEKALLTPQESLEWIALDASIATPSPRGVNPYHLGRIIFEYIDGLYHGSVPDGLPKRDWNDRPIDYSAYRGRKDHDIFWVRANHNDSSFIRDYLPDYLIEEYDLYAYKHQNGEWRIVEKDPSQVRELLVEWHATANIPLIQVEGADYQGRRELYLKHVAGRSDLDTKYATLVLKGIAMTLWRRSVHLETSIDEKPTLFTATSSGEVTNKRL